MPSISRIVSLSEARTLGSVALEGARGGAEAAVGVAAAEDGAALVAPSVGAATSAGRGLGVELAAARMAAILSLEVGERAVVDRDHGEVVGASTSQLVAG